MKLKKGLAINEDELPELTDKEYNDWYNQSWLSDGLTDVRMGWGVVLDTTRAQQIKENKQSAAIKNKGLKSMFSINNSKVKDVREFNKKEN